MNNYQQTRTKILKYTIKKYLFSLIYLTLIDFPSVKIFYKHTRFVHRPLSSNLTTVTRQYTKMSYGYNKYRLVRAYKKCYNKSAHLNIINFYANLIPC